MIKEGDKILVNRFWGESRLEIMAIRGNYVMARFKGAMPFVKTIKEIQEIINHERI